MQPPPRKVKESQQVKLVFSEQLSKLQTKQHQDSELLEEIRSFSKQRAAIEKEYAQALQRLAVQHQKRDWQRGNTDAVTSGSVFGVWRSLVDATAHTAASRLAAAEEYRKLIGLASRSLHNAKDIRAKRGLERLQRVQGEVVEALRELHRVKKSYHQLSHITNIAREKAADAQTRARKSEHGIFHFKIGLQKMTAKLGARLKECDDRLTEVRNEYLLTLAAVNTHRQHYHTHDLPLIMEQMDGDVYDNLRDHFTLLCGTEMDSSLATHKQFSRIWDSVAKVTRERNVQQFLQESASFTEACDFSFLPAALDQASVLQDISTSGEEGCLMKEAKKWAARAAKDYKIVAHGERVLQMLASRLKLLSGETGLSVEQKIAEVQESTRKAKLSGVKAEARLALLAESVAGVERWRRSAMDQAEEELERERRLSEQRRSTGDFSEDELELTDFEDYDDDGGDIFVEPVSASGVCVYPAACRVTLTYQAGQSDELSVTEGEELQVLEDGDVEDWLKVSNSQGQVGYVPERYVHFLCFPADDPAQLDRFSPASPPGGREEAGSRGELWNPRISALYAYRGQSAEELSFQEGALIRLTRRRQGAVDDGFWEGELDGKRGVFPSLVVELVQNEGEEQDGEEPHQTPSRPPSSPPRTTSSAAGEIPTGGCSPPGGLEDSQQAAPSDVSRRTNKRLAVPSEDRGSGQIPPEVPSGQLKPCRPPPPPPTQKLPTQW
ncbi:F-BAR and double SH3 domains protein 1-like [Cololabis saira]|uniref:F-BAR and double SH3 domains protein 1-like n=1 Tax=Cololabis saira TaxID=129043 RepID=UPI002AD3FA4D|nr:F-BAR and double SH3 domains protein 1-like [Cololabis saira]